MSLDPAAESGQPLLFDAFLAPHRSLSPKGFVILMSVLCAISFTAGLVFFLAGAWPVVGFMGADVLLIYLAFRINYKRGRMHETVRLTREALVVERVNHYGKRKVWKFQPYWLQVVMDDPPGHDSQLTLRSHGHSLVVGSFLTADERADLARELSRALHRVRETPEEQIV